jgi:ketopantoate reductase
MEIGIVGAEAVDGLFGGYLRQTDADVTLIDVGDELVQTANREGLRID